MSLNIRNSIAGLVADAGYSGNSTIYYASKTGSGYPWKIVATPSGKLTLFSTGYVGNGHSFDSNYHDDWSGAEICSYLNSELLFELCLRG